MESSVKTIEVQIRNKKGLHARAAAAFVKTIENMEADVEVEKQGQTVDGCSIMGLMMLAAAKGSVIHVKTEGREAQKAMDILTVLINAKFGEE